MLSLKNVFESLQATREIYYDQQKEQNIYSLCKDLSIVSFYFLRTKPYSFTVLLNVAGNLVAPFQ